MSRFKKGSAEAKAYMKKIRGMKHGKLYKTVKRHVSSVRHMARRRSYRRYFSRPRRRRSGGMTIPIAPVAGLVSGFLVPAASSGGNDSPLNNAMKGQWGWVAESVMENFTGMNIYTGQWNILNAKGLMASIAGLLVHKFVGGKPLNLNATLARAKVPFIRI